MENDEILDNTSYNRLLDLAWRVNEGEVTPLIKSYHLLRRVGIKTEKGIIEMIGNLYTPLYS